MTLIQTLVENDGGDLSVRSQLGFGTLSFSKFTYWMIG